MVQTQRIICTWKKVPRKKYKCCVHGTFVSKPILIHNRNTELFAWTKSLKYHVHSIFTLCIIVLSRNKWNEIRLACQLSTCTDLLEFIENVTKCNLINIYESEWVNKV
jgi:hypothetical protein